MVEEKIRFKAKLAKPDRFCPEQVEPAKKSGLRCRSCGCKLGTLKQLEAR